MRTLVVHRTTGNRYQHVGMADYEAGRIKYTTYRNGEVYNDHEETEWWEDDHDYWDDVILPPSK